MLYYRLRQTDLDGTITYSPVRSVTLTGAPVPAQLLAYPHPARDAVRVRLLGPAQAARPTGDYQLFGAGNAQPARPGATAWPGGRPL